MRSRGDAYEAPAHGDACSMNTGDKGNGTMLKNRQLEAWTGKFGDEYIARNEFAEWKVPYGIKAFSAILEGLDIQSVLEVGANVGLNLHYIGKVLQGTPRFYAVEPNRKAFKKLVSNSNLNIEQAWNCDAFNLPLPNSSVDIVFTAGVLIHIHPDNLNRAVDEIVRVSQRYILCIEYFSHEPQEIEYRGKKGMLFKRDFGSFYLDRHPNLKCVKCGFLWQREFAIFDNLTWWLFEK